MGNMTQDILAELEDLGATGIEAPAPPIETVEEVRVQQGSPAPKILDERGVKMSLLADTLITEFDTFIKSATTIRDALVEMKSMWSPVDASAPTPPPEPAPAREAHLEGLEDHPHLHPEDPSQEEPEPSIDVTGQGEPNAMGDITLVVPAAVPLPPEVEALEDPSWS